MNFVLICCVQNVESCERMLGLKVGPTRPHAAARLRAAQAELAAAEIASAPRVLVTTAGQISRTLKTRARAFPLF